MLTSHDYHTQIQNDLIISDKTVNCIQAIDRLVIYIQFLSHIHHSRVNNLFGFLSKHIADT